MGAEEDKPRYNVRARVVKGKSTVQQTSESEEDQEFAGAGALEPPYDPKGLANLFEDSSALRQNVDAYATNIDGFGYILAPVVDFDSKVGRETIRSDLERDSEGEVDDEKLDKQIAKFKKEAEAERVAIKNFLDYIGIGISFTALRKRTRNDLEITGNGYWELLRGEGGEIVKVVHVPSHTVRLMPQDEQFVDVTERQRVGALDWEELDIARKFRRYVQRIEGTGKFVYFKEFGDPRVVSSSTGTVHGTLEEMQASMREDEGSRPANEMIHWKIYSSSSAYGVPRWVGAMPSVLGSISMEDVNLAYFDNKGVPPLAVLVSGGVLSPESVKMIEDVIEKEIKGKKNFHKVLVLEATTEPGSNVSPKIELVPLMKAILSDAVFQKYDERGIDKVGSQFRLPRLVRGDVRDFNKSTAWASIRFAEEQVFSGERDEFDFTFNRTIFTDMKVKYWRLVSLGPTVRDPETIVAMVTDLAKVSVIVPNEARAIVSKALGIELPQIPEPWAKRPAPFTLAGRGFEEVEGAPVTEKTVEGVLDRLNALQKEIGELAAKMMDGVDDDDVRAFKQAILRHVGALDLEDFIKDAPGTDQGPAPDAAGGDGSAGGAGGEQSG